MRIRLVLMFFMCVAVQAFANPVFNSQEDIGRWVTYYYVKPEPLKIPDAIRYMSETKILDHENSLASIFGFLAGVFRANPEKIPGWMEQLSSLPEAHLGVIVLGLWYADLQDSQNRVYSILGKHEQLKEKYNALYQGSPMQIDKIPLEQGSWVLDALWGNFMATGKMEPVLRIMAALPWIDVKGDINRLMVGGAARWSLTSNSIQHSRVMEICEMAVKSQPKDVSVKLKEIILKAKQESTNGYNKALQPTLARG